MSRNYLKQNQEHQEQRHVNNAECRHSMSVCTAQEQRNDHHPDPQLQQQMFNHFRQPIERFRLVLLGLVHIRRGRSDAHLNWCRQMGKCRRLLFDFLLVKMLAHCHPENDCEKGFQENGFAGIFGVAYESDLGHVNSLHLKHNV